MNGWQALDDFLRTDPRAAGEPAGQRYPGLAAHLRACGPCVEDFEGLLAAIRGEAD